MKALADIHEGETLSSERTMSILQHEKAAVQFSGLYYLYVRKVSKYAEQVLPHVVRAMKASKLSILVQLFGFKILNLMDCFNILECSHN